MPSNVPDARKVVEAVCNLDCPCQCPATVKQWEIRRKWLRALALPKMRRDKAIRRAPDQRDPVTPEIEEEIWALYAANPEMTFDEIGRLVGAHGVDGGRVSEVVNGVKKKPLE